jgi:hypothetical protein
LDAEPLQFAGGFQSFCECGGVAGEIESVTCMHRFIP